MIGRTEKTLFTHYAICAKRLRELEEKEDMIGSDAWEEERVLVYELEDIITDCWLDEEFNHWLDRSPFKGEVDCL